MISNKFFNNRRSRLVAILLSLAVPGVSQTSSNNATIDTALNPSAIQSFLFKAVPTSFGPSRNRAALTSSVSSVSGDDLKSINTPNLGNKLFGKLAGLYVSQAGSAPGNNDNPGLSTRGKQTFQDNTVTVLVDGFETNWTTLLPEEIESVTVLKDAAALAMYGMDGANSVVLITTKRGSINNKVAVNLSARVGVHSATVLPKLLGNGDYAELYNIATVSDGKSISNGLFKDQSIVDAYKSGQYPYVYPNVDWYDELLKPNTLSHDYTLTFSGGRPDAKYFVAMGYANYQGLYANTESKRTTNTNYAYQRYNVRANFDVNINSFLSSQIGFRGTVLNKFFPNAAENTLWKTMAVFNPFPVKTDNGNWGGTQGYSENPAAAVLQKGYQSINDRTVDANVKLISKLNFITEGLQAFGQVAFSNFFYDTYNKTRGFSYDEIVARPDLATPSNPMPYDKVTRGTVSQNLSITQNAGNQFNRTNFLGGLEYERQFGRHGMYASAIYQQESYKANGSDMPYAKQGVMGRLSYNYQQKYFGEFAYSYSGSENFPKGQRFGFFPAVSAGWVLSKEAFLLNSKNINFLKLRASAGLLGNDRTGNSGRFIFNQYYVGAGTYFIGNNLATNAPMYAQGNLANPGVTWEKAFRTNVGVDAVLFKKLSVALDYFIENRDDIFINPSNYLPAIMGVSAYNVNKGKTKNAGGEMEVAYKPKLGAVNLVIGGNVSYARNEIVTMQEPPRPNAYLNAKGNPINQPFVLEAIGFFKDDNDILKSPKQLFGDVRPGDIKYRDQNNDGFIDDNDRVPTGHTNYPEIIYALNAGANYKGFDFSVLFQGAANRTVSLLDASNIIPFLNGGVKPTQWVKDNYWTPERGDAAKFPRLTTETNNNNYRASTLWQRNGAFTRLRDIELGYTLPASVLQRYHLNNLRIYLSGNNIATWDKINEIEVDPEVMNMFVHPPMKSFSFGINLGL